MSLVNICNRILTPRRPSIFYCRSIAGILLYAIFLSYTAKTFPNPRYWNPWGWFFLSALILWVCAVGPFSPQQTSVE